MKAEPVKEEEEEEEEDIKPKAKSGGKGKSGARERPAGIYGSLKLSQLKAIKSYAMVCYHDTF